jgi:hypothetical protein
MASFTVSKNEPLGPFLVAQGIQPWRVDPLVRCRGVIARRKGERVDLDVYLSNTPMRKDDEVVVEDTSPSTCVPMMTLAANKLGRDYGITGPPLGAGDQHVVFLARLLRARPDTIVLAENETLAGLVERIGKEQSITHPIRDLIVACHASPAGALTIPMKAGGERTTNFEDLEQAIKDGTLAIERDLVVPRPQGGGGFPLPLRFLIKGCGVGWAVPFLRKLKEAFGLGGLLSVLATRYYHGSGYYSGPSGTASYEFLAYEFWAWGPEPLKTRQEVRDAFAAKGYTDYTGKPIASGQWESWVPDVLRYDREMFHQKSLRFDSKLAGRELTALSFFSGGEEKMPVHVVPANEDPGKGKSKDDADKARFQAMRDYLAKAPLMQATHEFPYYQRLLYNSLEEMIDGFRWTFKYDTGKKAILCHSVRFLYTVHQPITEAGGSALIHNVFPTRPAGPGQRMFDDGDARFFVRV